MLEYKALGDFYDMERFAASTVFSTNMAIVMGPTPPGTGVMAEAFSLIESKSTSPTNL
jgi:hypothetical protein